MLGWAPLRTAIFTVMNIGQPFKKHLRSDKLQGISLKIQTEIDQIVEVVKAEVSSLATEPVWTTAQPVSNIHTKIKKS